jgi:predicted ATPase
MFEMMRGDFARAAPLATALAELAREHDLKFWGACAAFVEGWTATRDDLTAGRAQMRHGLDLLNIVAFEGLFKGAFAVAEARAGDYPAALATLDHAASVIERTGERWFDAELHRTRGEILVKQNPAAPAPAEAAFLTAIAVAREQKARSFELRAALSLAKLYQSTGRHVEAHDILAPALEGFAPTPEMPEIDEGQALLAAFSETDAWKSAAGSRERRLKLQTGYGHAMAMSRGFASEEAKAAFARVRELATKADNTAERFAAPWGQWIGSIFRGELGLAREMAEIFVRETTGEAWMTEAGVARRMLGLTCLYQGDLIEARAHLEEAARTYDPERDRDAKFRFGVDTGASATLFLAHTRWQLGEIGRAQELIEEAVVRAVESAHGATQTNAYYYKALFEIFRGNAAAALSAGRSVVELSRKHGLTVYLALGKLSSSWAHARLGERAMGTTELREALAAHTEQGNKLWVPLIQGLLAELEAEGQDAEGASSRIDGALALAVKTGERWTDALLHRIRGDILLKVRPDAPAPAEQAFLAAIAVAREQGARSFCLQAALKLAKLYQSTARSVEAHAVLAPALEGFTPTPEFPEIEEAQALLDTLS